MWHLINCESPITDEEDDVHDVIPLSAFIIPLTNRNMWGCRVH